MLVYCSEVKDPKKKAWSTISQTGVCEADGGEEHEEQAEDEGVGDEHAAVAEVARIRGMMAFRLMAAMAWGIISRPDWIGREAEADLIEQAARETGCRRCRGG